MATGESSPEISPKISPRGCTDGATGSTPRFRNLSTSPAVPNLPSSRNFTAGETAAVGVVVGDGAAVVGTTEGVIGAVDATKLSAGVAGGNAGVTSCGLVGGAPPALTESRVGTAVGVSLGVLFEPPPRNIFGMF